MNVMGVGALELVVIMLVAFLVLGPGRSIEMARTVGKVLGDLRRTFNDVVAAASLEELEQSHRQPAPPSREEEERQPTSNDDE